MKEDLIEEIWQRAPEVPPMSEQQLLMELEPRAKRGSRALLTQAWCYLILQAGTLLLASLNIATYRADPVMLSVEIGLVVLALVFGAYGVHIHGEIRRLDRRDENLEASLRSRLTFYRSNAKAWMWLAALSLCAFSFALNSFIENVDGHYPINKPLVFILIQVAMVLIAVLALSMTHGPQLHEVRAVLEDLQAQRLDRTLAVDRERERISRWSVLLVVALSIFAALGAWLAWRGMS